MGKERSRDEALDIFKGLLTVLMVYCHVLQFFGDGQLFWQNEVIVQAANLLVFPGFVYAFGRNCERSYYSKPFSKAAPRMLMRALRLYGAFALSGIGFRVLRENKPLAAGTARRVLLLSDIPGWSEFIIAFALFYLLALLLHAPMRKAKGPLLPALAGAASLLFAFIPYGAVGDTRLQLLIGGEGFACFPVAQYAGFFLLGAASLRAEGDGRAGARLLLLAALLSALGLLRALSLGGLPRRFPPDIGWLLLPHLPIALLAALARGLAALRLPLRKPLAGAGELRLPLAPLRAAGRASMAYLLLSNLMIFTMAGKGLMPVLKPRGGLLFGQPIQSPLGALWWTLALLLSIALILSLAPGAPLKRKENAP